MQSYSKENIYKEKHGAVISINALDIAINLKIARSIVQWSSWGSGDVRCLPFMPLSLLSYLVRRSSRFAPGW